MTPKQIKGRILLAGYSIEDLADRIGERRDVVSQTINYLRVNERVRVKIRRAVPTVRFRPHAKSDKAKTLKAA